MSAVRDTGTDVVWELLPNEIVQLVGQYLGAPEWSAARAVCRHWRDHITGAIDLLEVDLERLPHRWIMVLGCVRRIFPRLHSVVLLVGSRISAALFADRMLEMAINLNITDLELRFLPSLAPRLGASLSDCSAVTELRQLRSLRLSGGPTPHERSLLALSALRQLEDLEVLPGDYGNMGHETVASGATELAASPTEYGLTDAHMMALAHLPALKRLTTKVLPEAFSEAGLAAITGALTGLQVLQIYDSELASSSLRLLSSCSSLRSLQLGVCDCADLAPLAALPGLRDLYIDASRLPDPRALVAAVGRSGLPSTGPGALTGLYMVDQLFPSSAHVACVGGLSSLRELVIENPRVPEGSRVAWELSVLSGLSDLQLLQLDRTDSHEFHPLITPASVRLLAGGCWPALTSLDLFNLGPDELPTEAIAELSRFSSLRCLSINGSPGSGVTGGWDPPPPPPRQLAWWRLPRQLTSLNLTGFDLRGPLVRGGGAVGGRGAGAAGVAGAAADAVAGGVADGGTAAGTAAGCAAAGAARGDGGSDADSDDAAPRRAGKRRQRRRSTRGCASTAAARDQFDQEEEQQLQQSEDDVGTPLGSTLGAKPRTGQGARRGRTGAVAAAPSALQPPANPGDHFSTLQHLRLQHCQLPPSFLPALLPALRDSLSSLSLLHVGGTTAAQLEGISQLTPLFTLRLQPSDHCLEGLEFLAPLRSLKQLQLKLTHLQQPDLDTLSRLSSLFTLSLTVPMLGDQLLPGFPSAVSVPQVEGIVAALPYADLELLAEPQIVIANAAPPLAPAAAP